MMIFDDKRVQNETTFRDVEESNVFELGGDVYLKVPMFTNDYGTEYNSYDFIDNVFQFVEDDAEVILCKAKITVSY